MAVKHGRASFVDSHLLVQDLKHRTSRKDLNLRIVVPHKLVALGSWVNRKFVVSRNGSYRTAKEPS
jgi:hypothetical protein